MEPTGAVSWYETQLHPWHYFGATFKGEAIFVLGSVHYFVRFLQFEQRSDLF